MPEISNLSGNDGEKEILAGLSQGYRIRNVSAELFAKYYFVPVRFISAVFYFGGIKNFVKVFIRVSVSPEHQYNEQCADPRFRF